MTSSIDASFQELIRKVEESQYLIDDLKMQVERLKLKLESQKKLKEELESQKEELESKKKLQEELEYYFLLSQNQLEILKKNEALQAQAIALLASLTKLNRLN
jgi:hypothetical protein